jgi:hypothetical protein
MGRRDYRRVRESAKVAQKIERDNRLKKEKEGKDIAVYATSVQA